MGQWAKVAKVTSKGQVTIPKDVREALGVGRGNSLIFEVEGEKVTVSAVKKTISFADYEGAWREGSGMDWDEVNAYVRDLRGRANDAED